MEEVADADGLSREFSTREVSELTGIPLRTLQRWAGDFITPSGGIGTRGPGGGHSWTFHDLVVLRVAAELRKALETNLQILRKVEHRLKEYTGRGLADVMLVVSQGDAYCVTGNKLMSLLREPGQLAVRQVINLENVQQEMRDKVGKLAA